MLLRGHTIEETLMARDTVIFLLQQLGFVLNLKKSVLTPIQRIEFLAVTIDSLITKSLILKSSEAVPRTSSENISVDFRINKTNRLIVFNYSNSSSSTSLEESELRPNRKKFPCHTKLAVSNLVSPSTRNVYSLSTATSKEHKLKKPTRGSSSSNCKQNITTSGVDHIRERLLKKGVSETAAQFITSTRQKSLESNYNSSWSMWASWCAKQRIDAFRCDVIKILDYLAFLFEKSYEYRTIGCNRSAISAFHDYVDRKHVGQHPEVCALVSGIFNNRPPQPRYMFV